MSDTSTINGLHSCKPGNDPVVGQVKLFVIENRKGKSGKPYIKIRSANAENGGTPHRILGAEKTDFVDQHGNVSYNLEIEQSSSPPTAFANARATMQQGEHPDDRIIREQPVNEPQSPPHVQQGEDGVTEARKRLCQVANLYALCLRCANSHMIADEIPDDHKTNDQFQSTLASIWIYMSSRRSNDGVTWWDYTDKMPTTPVNGGKHMTTASSKPKPSCTCENTDGDNPLCPVHST